MAAKIDGTAIAKAIRQGLKTEIEETQIANPRFKPNLIIFQGKHLAPVPTQN
jgi:methylenetetrahydrofolate dehydrogenase (NADP+)/methenyltetrahydrofolate cyclohydrolase/formyltetrahydrofolate synthetase